MKNFADLHDALVQTPQRDGKLRLLVDYLARTPDPDRGWAIAALAGTLDLPRLRPATLHEMAERRLDPVLLALSLDYVGDLVETVSLIWPTGASASGSPAISHVLSGLQRNPTETLPAAIEDWLAALSVSERYALLRLLTGRLRVGTPAPLLRTALARYGGKPVTEIDELWHGLTPPYAGLFRWLDGSAPAPQVDTALAFRPPMRAAPLADGALAALDPADYAAEWTWDGVPALLAARDGRARLYGPDGDDIGRGFPDLLDTVAFDAVLDGQILSIRDGAILPRGDVLKRLGRKTVSARTREAAPMWFRVHDILFEGDEDLRPLPFATRRRRLEGWFARTPPERVDLSPPIPFAGWDDLSARLATSRAAGTAGLMLKRRDAPYRADAPAGDWLAWDRAPQLCHCVLMYVGRERRGSTYSIGCWRRDDAGNPELVPVGRIDGGIADDERIRIDAWVAAHAVDRFGPVVAVPPALVWEVAFAAVDASRRHKAGLVLRKPRFRRVLWDRGAHEAHPLETLRRLAT